jgi:hypothetical protein
VKHHITQCTFVLLFSTKVRQKNFNQGPVDPDYDFNRDHDRVEKILSKVRQNFFTQGLIEIASIKV